MVDNKQPLSTTATISHFPIRDSTSNTRDTSLSRKAIVAMNENNHTESLKILMSSIGIYMVKSPCSSTASGNEPSGTSSTALIQRLKAKIVDLDLF